MAKNLVVMVLLILTIVSAVGLVTLASCYFDLNSENNTNINTINQLRAKAFENSFDMDLVKQESSQRLAGYEDCNAALEKVKVVYPKLYDNYITCFWGSYGAITPDLYANHFSLTDPSESIANDQWGCAEYDPDDWDSFVELDKELRGLD